jgi:hypothetical protein
MSNRPCTPQPPTYPHDPYRPESSRVSGPAWPHASADQPAWPRSNANKPEQFGRALFAGVVAPAISAGIGRAVGVAADKFFLLRAASGVSSSASSAATGSIDAVAKKVVPSLVDLQVRRQR